MSFSKEQMLAMYDEIVRSRVLGETIIEYIYSGKISGSIHPCVGQEAVTGGIISAMNFSGLNVYCTGTHRGQTLMAHKVGFSPFIGEVLGRTSGACGGVSGEYHLTSIENGLIPATGALGGTWGILDGVAWAVKNQGLVDSTVVLAPYGDGASSEGPTFEALNMAALYKLPILFFIENNGIAMSTPVSKQYPMKNLSERAKAFGMYGITVDGNDVEAVTQAVLDGFARAQKCEPSLVEVKTCRWEGHYIGEDQSIYREPEIMNMLKDPEQKAKIDPVLIHEAKLRELGYADQAYMDEVHAKMRKEIEEAFDYNLAQGFPDYATVVDYNRMYSNDAGGEL